MSTLKRITCNKKTVFFVCILIFVIINLMVQSNASDKNVKVPVASGTTVAKNQKASIDTSNAKQGYVMVKYTGKCKGTVKVIVQKGSTSYTYKLFKNNDYEAFPLTEGNGSYKINVYEQISGNQYTTANSTTINVTMDDSLLPFLYANQYVNFKENSKVVSLANSLIEGKTDIMSRVQAVYEYVINNFKYDYAKAKSVQSGYVCDIDTTLKDKKGICLDYSAVMAAMLRTQGIPTKLVVGYAGTQYHAWISVYSKETGWIENVIYFDGKNWTMMDPTFASTNRKSDFKPEANKYSAKYTY